MKGIIFDLDGTLIQLPINNDNIQKNIKEMFDQSENLVPLIPTIVKLSNNNQRKINAAFDLICKEEVLASKNFKILDGTIQVLKFLKSKDLVLCLITMQCREALDVVLEQMQVTDLFDSITSRDESHDRLEQIKISLKNTSLEPSQVMMVGDRIHDVVSAKKAGCMPVLKINEVEKIPPFRCKIIKNIVEVESII